MRVHARFEMGVVNRPAGKLWNVPIQHCKNEHEMFFWHKTGQDVVVATRELFFKAQVAYRKDNTKIDILQTQQCFHTLWGPLTVSAIFWSIKNIKQILINLKFFKT